MITDATPLAVVLAADVDDDFLAPLVDAGLDFERCRAAPTKHAASGG